MGMIGTSKKTPLPRGTQAKKIGNRCRAGIDFPCLHLRSPPRVIDGVRCLMKMTAISKNIKRPFSFPQKEIFLFFSPPGRRARHRGVMPVIWPRNRYVAGAHCSRCSSFEKGFPGVIDYSFFRRRKKNLGERKKNQPSRTFIDTDLRGPAYLSPKRGLLSQVGTGRNRCGYGGLFRVRNRIGKRTAVTRIGSQ